MFCLILPVTAFSQIYFTTAEHAHTKAVLMLSSSASNRQTVTANEALPVTCCMSLSAAGISYRQLQPDGMLPLASQEGSTSQQKMSG